MAPKIWKTKLHGATRKAYEREGEKMTPHTACDAAYLLASASAYAFVGDEAEAARLDREARADGRRSSTATHLRALAARLNDLAKSLEH